jgi:hypothetical protein
LSLDWQVLWGSMHRAQGRHDVGRDPERHKTLTEHLPVTGSAYDASNRRGEAATSHSSHYGGPSLGKVRCGFTTVEQEDEQRS